jgi:hypothetical protein
MAIDRTGRNLDASIGGDEGGGGPVPGQPQPSVAPDTSPIPLAGDEPIPVSPPKSTAAPSKPKIQAFAQQLTGKRHEDQWQRTPNVTGTGAIHLRSFHCKLNSGSLEMLDQQINEWLDEHPQYEVKFVTTSIGDWTGKTREPNLVVQVWV